MTKVEHKSIYAALAAFQGEVPSVEKDKKARIPTQSRVIEYTYSDLATIITTIKPFLAKHGLAISQPLEVGESLVVYLKTVLMHEGGQSIESRMKIDDWKDMKGLGTNITYLRRYSLSSLLGLASEDDIDATAEEFEEPPKAPPVKPIPSVTTTKISSSKCAELQNRIDYLEPLIKAVDGVGIWEPLKKHFKINQVSELTVSQAAEAERGLKHREDKHGRSPF